MRFRLSFSFIICVSAGLIQSATAGELLGDSNVSGTLDVEGNVLGKVLMLGSSFDVGPGFSIHVLPTEVNDSEAMLQINRAESFRAEWNWRNSSNQTAMQLIMYGGDTYGGQLWVDGTINARGIYSLGPVTSYGLPVLTLSGSGDTNIPGRFTVGSLNNASGSNSTAFGTGNYVSGDYSTAFGHAS